MAQEVYIEDLIMREFDNIALHAHEDLRAVIRTSPVTLPIGVVMGKINGSSMTVGEAVEWLYRVEEALLRHSALENGKPLEMATEEAASIMKRRRSGRPV